ncbi:Homeobox-leucine zipper protein HAT14 [Linum perenne]
MELALSLGDASKPFKFLDKSASRISTTDHHLSFGIGGSGGAAPTSPAGSRETIDGSARVSPAGHPQLPLQLDLLPFSPVGKRPSGAAAAAPEVRFPWLVTDPALTSSEHGATDGSRRFDVNRLSAEEGDDGASLSSPNSAASSFQMDFGIGLGSKRDLEGERAGSRASDDDENGSTRKKLRLSKDQSAFLEESFKEHSTLNPKQKQALAKQLNLRPRQVEVWFQNRRARTKLKQTEVDCEYLKRCCETLTEENRRLQKELQELRALKTSQPFYMQPPATTLTMCPSCERVATTTTAAPAPKPSSSGGNQTNNNSSTILSLGNKLGGNSSNGSRMYPFSDVQQLQMSQQKQPNKPADS